MKLKIFLLSLLILGVALLWIPKGFAQITNPSSGSGVGSGASPIMAFYLAPQCPASNTGQCFQTSANTQVIQNCTFNTGTANVVCASGTFAATDVGKFIWGFSSCNPFLSQPGNANITTTHNTIQTFVSSTTVTMNAVGASGTTTTGCVVFGTPDDTGAAALSTAVASLTSSPTCPKIFLSAAQYMFTTPPGFMFNQPPGCAATPGLAGGGAQGNLFYELGMEVEGRGPATTILWIPPDFPESGSCTHGTNSNACFAVPLEGRFSNFQISCGNGSCGQGSSVQALMNVDVGSLEYYTCTGWGDGAAVDHAGVLATHWAQLQQVNVSACGTKNLEVYNSSQVTCFRCSLENANGISSSSANLLSDVGSQFTCFSCQFDGSLTGSLALANIVSNGGTVTMYHSNAVVEINTGGSFAYQCLTATCNLILQDFQVVQNGATTAYGLFCNVQCNIDLTRTSVTAAGAGIGLDLTTSAASIFYNRGGNTFSGGSANVNSGFTMNFDSQGKVGITAAKAVLSGGWGTTAAWTALNGGNSFSGTITASGSGQAANPTITYTFPQPYIIATPFCQAIQTGGTQAAGTFSASSVSTTGVTFTYSGTPGAANTIFVQVFCQ